jgi:glycosyltransferase involved in cell wall biosynthesis
MGNFYFLNYSYNPNTAATNRMLAYMKGLSELGISTNVLFFLTDKSKSKIENKLPNINVEYYWDKWYYINNKYLKHLCYTLFVWSFLLRVKAGDTVYMYNMADVLHFLLKKKGVRVFVEKTEHPSMYALGSKVYHPSLSRYFKDCVKATGIITISTSLRQLFLRNGVDEKRVSIVNMIADENRFTNVVSQKYDNPYFAYCGTVSTFKDGVDILLKAFRLVAKKHSNVKLRIAGKFASKEDERTLKSLVEELELSKQVIFMGIVSAAEMPSFLAGSEAVVLSRPNNIQAQNGFPGKLGEYLLSKSPAIVTAVGDIPLFVKDGINGFVVEPNNAEVFAEKMNWVIEHPTESREIGKEGANLAHKEFNYLKETKKLVDFMNVR